MSPEKTGWEEVQERELRATFYSGATGCIFVFNVRDRQSFEAIPKWMREVDTHLGEVPAVLVGTHGDRPDLQTVSFIEAAKFAEQHNMTYFETSTEVGPDFKEPLHDLAYKLTADLRKDPYDEEFGY